MSSSTPYHTIAVAGAALEQSAGHRGAAVGSFIVNALINSGAAVHVLARATSVESPRAVELRKQGVKILVVDYNDPSSIQKALAGVDVVVSALSGEGLKVQSVLADASKAAGVKLFVPSEFGVDSVVVEKDSPSFVKREMQQHLRSIELPYTLFFNGMFAEWARLVVGATDGKFEVVGDGNAPLTFTSLLDIAAYVAHVLTTLPPSELDNRIFRLEGSRLTFLDFVPLIEKKVGKVEVVHVSVEEAFDRFKKKGLFTELLRAEWALGKGLSGTEAQVKETRALFEGWEPKSVEAFL